MSLMNLDSLSDAANFIQRTSRELHARVYEDEFTYTPLPGPSDIRLLKLHAGTPGDSISCSLRAVSLDQGPEFTALSYSWRKQLSMLQTGGTLAWEKAKAMYQHRELDTAVPETEPEALPTKTIRCNGKRIGVTPSLYDVLLSFRRTRPGGEEYWIDGICMNQGDNDEKTAQVRIMDRIYKAAQLVLVWLGDCPPNIARGLPGLEALARVPAADLPPVLYDEPIPAGGKSRSEVAASVGFAEPNKNWVPFEAAASTALDLTNRQWFKRIWVLQEFFLASRVVFLCGDHRLSPEAVLTAFTWVHRNPGAQGSFTPATMLKGVLGPLWMSHAQDVPSMLLARQPVLQGRRFTLREWIRVCKGRQATNSKDFIFGGLSLIQPESRRIDRRRLQATQHACRDDSNDAPPALPPRPGAPSRGSQQISSAGGASGGLIPNGLWDSLEVDYSVSEAELLVNVAACLLSREGSHGFDLLSLSARGRESLDELSGLRPSGNIPAPDLPSWAPALGSWTSRIVSNLSAAAPAAGGGGKAFAAGTLGQPPGEGPRPVISRDGTTLSLDAVPVDTVDEVLLGSDFTTKMEKAEYFLRFLENVVKLPHAYLSDSGATSFDAVATALASACTLETDDTFNTGSVPPQSPPPPQAEGLAPVWLCEFLDREVRHRVGTQRKGIARLDQEAAKATDPAEAEKKEKSLREELERLDRLTSTYRQLVDKFPHVPWSGTADQGPEALPPASPAQRPRRSENDETKQRLREKDTLSSRLALKLVSKAEALNERLPDSSDSWRRAEDISPGAARYVKALVSALLWRCVFRTRDGLVGMGPQWLRQGDTVMLVRGAGVPYVLRHVDEDLRLGIDQKGEKKRALEGTVAKRRKSPEKRKRESVVGLEEEIARLGVEIGRLEAQVGRRDGFVLIGEAYVEGVMLGEVLERAGSDCFGRIAVV